jgi:hypothetical protein
MVKCCEPKRKGGRPVHRLSVSSKGVLTNLLYTWWKRRALLAQLSSEHQTGGKKKRPLVLEPIGCSLSMRKRPGLNNFFCALLLSILFLFRLFGPSRSSPTSFSLAERSGSIDPICTSASSCCCLLRAGAYMCI